MDDGQGPDQPEPGRRDEEAPQRDRRERVAAGRIADRGVATEEPGPHEHHGERQDGSPGDRRRPVCGPQDNPAGDDGRGHRRAQRGHEGGGEQEARAEGREDALGSRQRRA